MANVHFQFIDAHRYVVRWLMNVMIVTTDNGGANDYMLTSTLLTILQASHYTHLVAGEWEERGGIILVAPPGKLKSTFIKTLNIHPDVLLQSDVNVPTLARLRDDISGGRYRTLAFPDFDKLYQRHPNTSANIEGHIMAFTEQGFKNTSFEDARSPGQVAQALVVGGLTPSLVRKKWEGWCDNGFARRFLWINYTFTSNIIADAIERWKKFSLGEIVIRADWTKQIHYNLNQKESHYLRQLVKEQRGQETPYVLLKRIMCVLRAMNQDAMKIMKDFAPALTERGAMLERITEPRWSKKR